MQGQLSGEADRESNGLGSLSPAGMTWITTRLRELENLNMINL